VKAFNRQFSGRNRDNTLVLGRDSEECGAGEHGGGGGSEGDT